MIKLAFFDTKPYDKDYFDEYSDRIDFIYYENKLNELTASLAADCQAVCAFVNDDLNEKTIDILYKNGVKIIAMRSAGYSNVDFKSAFGKINIVHVPSYSPYAVAEHAMALLLTLNRKTHKAYNRTRDFNFSLTGLTGTDLRGKTMGVIGTGKIGRVFIEICKGFGMKIAAYDLYPAKDLGIEYMELDKLYEKSDFISLHCPLTEQTYHIINEKSFCKMKKNVIIINTSRGALIESGALLKALNNGQINGAGLDVYEEEANLFFEDFSGTILKDDVLALLISRPNVLVTSHQAFLTGEALGNIAKTTVENLEDFFADRDLKHEVCYQCLEGKNAKECRNEKKARCF